VSEIARTAIDAGKGACLILSISDKKERFKKITATIFDDKINFITVQSEGYKYARKLVDDIELSHMGKQTTIELHYNIAQAFRVDDALLEKWVILFNADPEVSPYEEIKRKNKQLVELSDKLRESEGQYRKLTNSLPLMIFTLDEAGNVTYANNWLQEYTGQTVETLNQTNWKEVVHPDDGKNPWSEWEEDNADYKPLTIETRLRDGRSGEYKWYTGIVTPIMDDNGELMYWTAYLADINAQKTVEQALKDNKELKEMQTRLEENIQELNRSNEELARFAYIASHDLQEPLRKIGFYSDYLGTRYRPEFSEEALGVIGKIQSATERMKALIHDVLAYSTIDKGALTFSNVDLNAVASEAVHDLEIAITETAATVEVGPLPQIEGNENQLKQLFENILSNSLKYARADVAPRIRISCVTKGDNVEISFSDNGIGFEEKYLDRMFALFQRLHGRDKYMGTGIGLAICKKIVEIHQGEMMGHSQLGEGAIFVVRLPKMQSRD
jgi:PAS domain S-box-containing protein